MLPATRGWRPGVLLSVLKRTGQPPLQRRGSESEVAQSDCSPPGASGHGIFQARILGWVAIPFSRGSFQPRDRTGVSPELQVDCLPSELPGKLKSAGLGSLFLLQGIFPDAGIESGSPALQTDVYQLIYLSRSFLIQLLALSCG